MIPDTRSWRIHVTDDQPIIKPILDDNHRLAGIEHDEEPTKQRSATQPDCGPITQHGLDPVRTPAGQRPYSSSFLCEIDTLHGCVVTL